MKILNPKWKLFLKQASKSIPEGERTRSFSSFFEVSTPPPISLWAWVFCLHVFLSTMCMPQPQRPEECLNPWGWSCRWLWAATLSAGYWNWVLCEVKGERARYLTSASGLPTQVCKHKDIHKVVCINILTYGRESHAWGSMLVTLPLRKWCQEDNYQFQVS